MKVLKQIIKVVSRKRISKVDIFDKTLLSAKDSKFTQFYDAIESGDVDTDLEASILLYGEENSDSFRQLKSRFRARLLNTLFFLDLNNSSGKVDYKYAHYSCMKALMHAKLLRFFGAFDAAAYIIKKKYSDAKKYHFYDILAEYSGFLFQYYSLDGDTKSLKEEKANFIEYKNLADSENICRLAYFSSIVEFARTGAVTDYALEELNKGIAEIEEEIKSFQTVVNIYYLQQLKIILYDATYDYSSLVKECDITYSILNKHTYFTDQNKIGLITFRKLIACLNLRDYKQGLELYGESLNVFSEGSINWFNLRKFGALLATHSGDRSLGYKIYLEGIASNRSKNMSASSKEFWSIYGAYCLFYLRIFNEQDKVPDIEELQKFRLYKFLNEVPNYTRDKEGYNVSLLIIKYIFSLLDEKYGDIITGIDSLKVYRSRYLTDVLNKRAYTFIGMLLRLEKIGFVYKVAETKCQKELNLLKANRYGSGKSGCENWPVHEWEIIPFEDLWRYILKILEYNKLSDSVKANKVIAD